MIWFLSFLILFNIASILSANPSWIERLVAEEDLFRAFGREYLNQTPFFPTITLPIPYSPNSVDSSVQSSTLFEFSPLLCTLNERLTPLAQPLFSLLLKGRVFGLFIRLQLLQTQSPTPFHCTFTSERWNTSGWVELHTLIQQNTRIPLKIQSIAVTLTDNQSSLPQQRFYQQSTETIEGKLMPGSGIPIGVLSSDDSSLMLHTFIQLDIYLRTNKGTSGYSIVSVTVAPFSINFSQVSFTDLNPMEAERKYPFLLTRDNLQQSPRKSIRSGYSVNWHIVPTELTEPSRHRNPLKSTRKTLILSSVFVLTLGFYLWWISSQPSLQLQQQTRFNHHPSHLQSLDAMPHTLPLSLSSTSTGFPLKHHELFVACCSASFFYTFLTGWTLVSLIIHHDDSSRWLPHHPDTFSISFDPLLSFFAFCSTAAFAHLFCLYTNAFLSITSVFVFVFTGLIPIWLSTLLRSANTLHSTLPLPNWLLLSTESFRHVWLWLTEAIGTLSASAFVAHNSRNFFKKANNQQTERFRTEVKADDDDVKTSTHLNGSNQRESDYHQNMADHQPILASIDSPVSLSHPLSIHSRQYLCYSLLCLTPLLYLFVNHQLLWLLWYRSRFSVELVLVWMTWSALVVLATAIAVNLSLRVSLVQWWWFTSGQSALCLFIPCLWTGFTFFPSVFSLWYSGWISFMYLTCSWCISLLTNVMMTVCRESREREREKYSKKMKK